MKNYIYTTVISISIFLVPMLFFACNYSNTKKEMSENTIKQKQKNLLAGVSEAICYSGFRTGQHPDRGEGAKNPSDNEILEDLKIISTEMGFKLIRLYDSGENSEAVLRLIKTHNLNVKVMLGIWLNAELSNHESCAWLSEAIPQEELDENKIKNKTEIRRGIELANRYQNIVEAVNVGNEALVDWNDHKVDTDTIISYVQHVKNQIKQKVTVAENYEWWAAHGEKLATELDFVAIHIYPVWEGKTIEEGLSYSIENIQKVRDALPNSTLVISEAGWATMSSEFTTQANQQNQNRYFNELMKWSEEMNITTFFFEAFDEDWKGNPDNLLGAEKHWGIYTVERKPKLIKQQD